MARCDPPWADAHSRWLRPDWERYVRPDWRPYMRGDWRDRKYWVAPPPDPAEGRAASADAAALADAETARAEEERASIRYELSALRFQFFLLKLADLHRKAGFREDQPRWLKGNGEISGRWSGGAGTAPPQSGTQSNAPTRGGHHFVPRKVFAKEPLPPETRQVFERGVTGPLNGGSHQNSRDHSIYNTAVSEHYDRFLRENGIRSEQMTPDQARKFLDELKRSNDPRVRGFNMRIYVREIMHWFRRMPRGNE